MRDDNQRDPDEAPVETEGMGGAGGGDLDDVGDVGFPRDSAGRDVTRGRSLREGMGGAGGGDVDDVGEVGNPDLIPIGDVDVDDMRTTSRAGREVVRGETGVVTGITTGVDTDDATEGPGSAWENLDDGLRDSDPSGSDTPD